MEYCKEGLRLVQEASHENIVEYNVNIKNILLFIYTIIETIS